MAGDIAGNANTNPATDFLGTADRQPPVLKTNGTEALRVDTPGRIGIGTLSPGYSLYLPHGKGLRIEGGTSAADTANYFSFGGWGTFGIDAPGVPNGRFVVQNDGNVGIGTASPKARLDIGGQLHVAGGQWDLTNTEGDLKIGNDAMRIKIGVALDGGGGRRWPDPGRRRDQPAHPWRGDE